MRISSVSSFRVSNAYASKVKSEKKNDYNVKTDKSMTEREMMKDFGIGRHIDARI